MNEVLQCFQHDNMALKLFGPITDGPSVNILIISSHMWQIANVF